MRRTAQVLLTLAATLCVPVGWFFLVFVYSSAHDGPASVWFAKAAAFFIGSLLGLIALWKSIFFKPEVGRTAPPRLLVAGLIIGLLLDALFLFGGLFSPPKNPDAPQILFLAWLVGGPVVVGAWNLIGILSCHEWT